VIRKHVPTISIFLFALTSQGASFDPAKLAAAAESQAGVTKFYDATYRTLRYPGGDVSMETGVCTDVVIRAYRALGFDLQQLVHQDMEKHFDLYPTIWSLRRPDANIDHRRVQNLRVFFTRFGASLDISNDPQSYSPGDLVTWNLASSGRAIPHIGIVTRRKSFIGRHPLIVHNIGDGVKIEDTLFQFKITGHYRYAP
jgi:uncharacterized protein YijF (DUF1287 family)